jgi:hypothetical protein
MEGYVDVAERIRQLREKHPQAVLRPWNPAEPFRIMEIGGREFIVYTAVCYRSPDDPMPAIAVAAEPAVGKTNFTRDSEVMNAETSAWGRCIVACLAADTQRIASFEEVRNRRADQDEPQSRSFPKPADRPNPSAPTEQADSPRPSSGPSMMSTKQKGLMMKLAAERGLGTDDLRSLAEMIFDGKKIESISDLSSKEASQMITHLMEIPT